MTSLSIFDHLLALLLGLILPFAALGMKLANDYLSEEESRSTAPEPLTSTDRKLALYHSNSLLQWFGLVMVVAVWIFNGRSMASLGLKWPEFQQGMLVLLLTIIFVIGYAYDTISSVLDPEAYQKLSQEWKENLTIIPANLRELRGFFWVGITAGICEEVLYRGFLINYLAFALEPNRFGLLMAVSLPAMVFGISHLYQGWEAVFKIVLLSLVFGALFVLTGSLLLPVVLHILVDVVGGWLSYRVVRRGESVN
jgi:membrane protease YdiL (CAAX protease family)